MVFLESIKALPHPEQRDVRNERLREKEKFTRSDLISGTTEIINTFRKEPNKPYDSGYLYFREPVEDQRDYIDKMMDAGVAFLSLLALGDPCDFSEPKPDYSLKPDFKLANQCMFALKKAEVENLPFLATSVDAYQNTIHGILRKQRRTVEDRFSNDVFTIIEGQKSSSDTIHGKIMAIGKSNNPYGEIYGIVRPKRFSPLHLACYTPEGHIVGDLREIPSEISCGSKDPLQILSTIYGEQGRSYQRE